MHNLCLTASLLVRTDSAQLFSLYAALGQTCVNWPISGELVFRRRCLKETKKECFRQRENTLSIKVCKPVLIVTQVKMMNLRISMINSFCTEMYCNVYSTWIWCFSSLSESTQTIKAYVCPDGVPLLSCSEGTLTQHDYCKKQNPGTGGEAELQQSMWGPDCGFKTKWSHPLTMETHF